MTELIVIMVLVGILAATALPRFNQLGAFDARGFRDQTASMLRYAQKQAIAQRRTVCVAIAPSAVTLSIDASTPADGVCESALTLPFQARTGTGLAGSGFNFGTMGETNQASDITLTITDADNIVVDRTTGYVR